jgi:hypothetical protein
LDCLITSNYQIDTELPSSIYLGGLLAALSEAMSTEPDKKPEKINVQDIPLKVICSAELKVGFKQCLNGELNLGKDMRVKVYIVDWNLDGKFSNDDMVCFGHLSNKELYPFEQPISIFAIGKAIKYQYFLSLTNDFNGKYILDIARHFE